MKDIESIKSENSQATGYESWGKAELIEKLRTLEPGKSPQPERISPETYDQSKVPSIRKRRQVTWWVGEFYLIADRQKDPDPDLSHLGTFSTTSSAPHALPYNERGPKQFFIAANEEYALEDMERMRAFDSGKWHMEGITVSVRFGTKVVAEAAIWSIESDAGGYVDEVMHDCASLALRLAFDFAEGISKALSDVLKDATEKLQERG